MSESKITFKFNWFLSNTQTLCQQMVILAKWRLFHFILYIIYLFICLLGPHVQRMEVPRLGIKSELQLLAYTTATAMQDPSCICDLHHSSWQCHILNPLSKPRDGTYNLMVPSWICFHCAMMELLDGMFYRYQLSPSGLMCQLRPVFLY